MISSSMPSLAEPTQRSRSPAVKTSLGLFGQLPYTPLKVMCEYLLAGDLQDFTRISRRVKHLAFCSSKECVEAECGKAERGEAFWTSLYQRDYPLSMGIAKESLPQPDPSLHTLQGLPALRLRALAALRQSSIWPATTDDVLATLYPAYLSVRAYSCQRILEGHTRGVIYITQLADGSLASGSYDDTVRIWPLNGGEPQVFLGHKHGVFRIIQLADGCLASTSYDGTMRIWPLDGRPPQVLEDHPTSFVHQIIQLKDGHMVSRLDDGLVRIWPPDRATSVVLAGRYTLLEHLADSRFALVSSDHKINIWSSGISTPLVLAGHTNSVVRVIQLADGRPASASIDGSIRIWSSDGSASRTLTGHKGDVLHLMQLFDGSIASASSDGSIRIWSLNGGAPRRVLKGHKDDVLHLVQLLDGSIASASKDGTMRVWPPNGGAPRVLTGHDSWVRQIIQLVDGRFASASHDGTIRIWGPDTNQLVRTATRQARYRKVMHKVSRKAILALGFVLLAWGVNVLFKTIARGATHTT